MQLHKKIEVVLTYGLKDMAVSYGNNKNSLHAHGALPQSTAAYTYQGKKGL